MSFEDRHFAGRNHQTVETVRSRLRHVGRLVGGNHGSRLGFPRLRPGLQNPANLFKPVHDFLGRLEAGVGVLLHEPIYDLQNFGRQAATDLFDRQRIFALVFEQFFDGRSVRKWRPAGQQEIKGAAEAVEVGSMIDLRGIAGLFRCDEIGRADHRAGLRQGAELAGIVERFRQPGQPHVEDLDGAHGTRPPARRRRRTRGPDRRAGFAPDQRPGLRLRCHQ